MPNQLNLSDREMDQVQAFYDIARAYGPWNQGPHGEGAHYFDEDNNPFIEEGMICGNCVFYLPSGRCQIVQGPIDYEGLCKLWVIPDSALEV